MFEGRVVSIFVAGKAGAPMEALDEVKVTPGRGIEGDRYFEGTGTWSNHPGEGREITLVEMERLRAWHAKRILPSNPPRRGAIW